MSVPQLLQRMQPSYRAAHENARLGVAGTLPCHALTAGSHFKEKKVRTFFEE
jgi:hypothetical protein